MIFLAEAPTWVLVLPSLVAALAIVATPYWGRRARTADRADDRERRDEERTYDRDQRAQDRAHDRAERERDRGHDRRLLLDERRLAAAATFSAAVQPLIRH